MRSIVETVQCDIVICGSGPAGIGAAVAARIAGAEPVLLEGAALPGGTMCAVPWMPINRLFTAGKQRTVVHQKFVDSLMKYGSAAGRPGRENVIDGDGIHTNPVYVELALYDLLEEMGIRYCMNSPVVDAIMEGNALRAVVVQEKRGLVAYETRIAIDATGDGDLAAAAGCSFEEGRETDGIHLPLTMGFSLGGLEEAFFDWYSKERERAFTEMLDRGEREGRMIAQWYDINYATVPGIAGVNHGAWRGQSLLSNGLNSSDRTAARRNGVRIAHDLAAMLREEGIPGAKNAFVNQIGYLLGVRDTRRVVGDYVVTFEDSQNNTPFYDGIARKYGHVDGNQVYIGPMASGYLYPYRAMLPKGIEGLLVAGRCGSSTFLGHCAGKSMGNMMEVGVAAGTAAALCGERGITPRALDPKILRAYLKDVMKVAL